MANDSLIIADNVYGHSAGRLLALQCSGGRIAGVECIDAAAADALLGSAGANALDARGLLLLPGLIDSHVHAIATGMMLLGENVSELTSLDALSAAIARASANTPGPVVRLGGLDLSRLQAADHAKLNRAWLNSQVSDRALIIKSVEGHSSWFNTKGWAMVVDQKIADELGVPAEQMQAMYESGRLLGGIYEKHTTPLYDSYSAEERREGMRRVIATAQRAGLCGIHCLEGYGERRREDFSMILDLDGQGVDLTLYCRDNTPALARELAVPRFGGCWCIDGAIGAHSAAVAEPYADNPASCGELYFDEAELSAWIESGIEAGMQVCLHAIGDRAIEQGLRCFEGLSGRHEHAPKRHRLDHFILGDKAQGERAARMGLCSGMQPAFDARWGGSEGGYARRLGAERALRSNPVGSMLASGMRVAGGSDAYITPLDPLGGIRAAMNHHNPAERVDFDTAVKLFTEDSAYLAHSEASRGRIATGYDASFTIVRGDRSLERAEVAATILRGNVVYRSEEPA